MTRFREIVCRNQATSLFFKLALSACAIASLFELERSDELFVMSGMAELSGKYSMQTTRLTHLVDTGGCVSKMGPAHLAQILSGFTVPSDTNLLVSFTSGDDAGVYRLTNDLALVQTVDFITPIVDDPYQFGQIAAANALSDIYAMGGSPITAMNILCYPISSRPVQEITSILQGGANKVAESGAVLVGGHSVEDAKPRFGLSVTGVIDPTHMTTNAGARPGDVVILTKPLGTGIIITAAKYDECDAATLEVACHWMSTLNAGACDAMRAIGIGSTLPIHAATDITGFGFLGHLFHLAKSSGVAIEIDHAAVPMLPEVERLATHGTVTSGDRRNRDYLADSLTIHSDVSPARLSVLLDPQTSGGLAICVAEGDAPRLLEALEARNVNTRVVVGRVLSSQSPVLTIR